MNTELVINQDNAESIGKPIFDKIIQSFLNADREGLIRNFPELEQWMTPTLFNEAVGVLNRLGECNSIQYSSYSEKVKHHSLDWKVRYSQEEEDVHWSLYLSDHQANITVAGFEFDR